MEKVKIPVYTETELQKMFSNADLDHLAYELGYRKNTLKEDKYNDK